MLMLILKSYDVAYFQYFYVNRILYCYILFYVIGNIYNGGYNFPCFVPRQIDISVVQTNLFLKERAIFSNFPQVGKFDLTLRHGMKFKKAHRDIPKSLSYSPTHITSCKGLPPLNTSSSGLEPCRARLSAVSTHFSIKKIRPGCSILEVISRYSSAYSQLTQLHTHSTRTPLGSVPPRSGYNPSLLSHSFAVHVYSPFSSNALVALCISLSAYFHCVVHMSVFSFAYVISRVICSEMSISNCTPH